MENTGHSLLSPAFLAQLVPELDDETAASVILHGSYTRGDATPPYSNIDLVRILKETPERRQQKRFLFFAVPTRNHRLFLCAFSSLRELHPSRQQKRPGL